MGEVTAEVDEEMTKQDFSLESLPEPLLIILSPPPPFLPVPGEPTMVWYKWLRAFEHYIEAIGENELVDSSKCMLLQNSLGAEGQRIFTTLMRSETTYAAAISALTVYFNSDPTSQMYCLQFHQRAQMPGETVDMFVSALDELLRLWIYEKFEEKLILDQLIEKTNLPQLRERLLLEGETLTLDKALTIGSKVESAFGEFGIHEVSVDIGDNLDPPVPIKRKRGRPRKGEERPKNQIKPCSTKTPTKSCTRYKDNYYYGNDNLYYSENEEESKNVEETNVARDEAGKDDIEPMSPSPQRTEEEDCSKASDDVNDDDDEEEDEDFSPSKLKGPYCPICNDRRFRDAHKLARHMRTHTKEKPYSCRVCAMTFSQSYHMTRHMRNQHGAGMHVCSKCGESLGSAEELLSHKRMHAMQVLSCPDCHEKFTNNDVYLVHVMSHSSDRSTQFGKTEGQSSQQSEEVKKQEIIESCQMGNHESDGSNDAENDADPDNSQDEGSKVNVKVEDKDAGEPKSQDADSPKEKAQKIKVTKGHFCPICVDRRFRGPNKLARHMRTHTKEKPFSCPVCVMTFSQNYHMTRHLRHQHGLGQYICNKCGKSLGTWLELKAHKKTHAVDGLTCISCDQQFKDKAALVSHLKLHKKVNSKPRSLVCGDCGKVFGRMYHLKRHIVTHRKATNGEFYTCPDCKKNFVFPEDLNKHLEIHLKENNGTCPKCDLTFSSPAELECHMELHAKSYPCKICGKKFKVEYALKKHEQSHDQLKYYCSLCCKHFLKVSHYKRHMMVHERRESRCPHCDTIFLQLTALKYHLRTHTAERPYQCTCCIETFEEKKDLEQHCLKHRKFKRERPYSCTRCDAAFSTIVELTDHMSSHEGEQPMSCPECGKTFLNKNKLEKHLSIHTGERPHLCSICGNGFPSAASLKLHVHIHTGEKPFQCTQCSKSFRSTSGLRLHSRQHMEVKPSYICPECGRTYGRMTELKMHQRYHTGDKPYACTCCSKRFISKDKLNVHMRIHTGERPYSCYHCGQTFTQTGDRNRHMSKYHSLEAAVENSSEA